MYTNNPLIVPLIICVGAEAKKLFEEAQLLLQKIIDKKLLKANGVITLLPAQSVDDDILVYDEGGANVIGTLYGLRQQVMCIQPLYIDSWSF